MDTKKVSSEQYIRTYVQQENLSSTQGVEVCQAGTVISIVIPAFNEEAGIAHTIESLLALDSIELAEIIFVDNNSTDRTAEIIQHYAAENSQLHIVLLRETKKGVGYARKRGMDEVVVQYLQKGDFNSLRLLAMTDADSELEKTWITTVLETQQRTDARVMTGLYQYPAWYNGPLIEGEGLLHTERGLRRKLFESGVAFRNTDGRNTVLEVSAYAEIGGIKQPVDAEGNPKPGEDFTVGVSWAQKGGEIVFLPNGALSITNPRRFVNWRLERLLQEKDTIVPVDYYRQDHRFDVEAAAEYLRSLETKETLQKTEETQLISFITYNISIPIVRGYHSPDKLIELFGSAEHPFIHDFLQVIEQAVQVDDHNQVVQMVSDVVRRNLSTIYPVMWKLAGENN